MKQKNSWCSWCVRVFVGGQDELWNTCGVGILTLCAGDIVVNTSQQLKDILTSQKNPDSIPIYARVRKQQGLDSPSEKKDAPEEIKTQMRGETDDDNMIMNFDLRDAKEFTIEKSNDQKSVGDVESNFFQQ